MTVYYLHQVRMKKYDPLKLRSGKILITPNGNNIFSGDKVQMFAVGKVITKRKKNETRLRNT